MAQNRTPERETSLAHQDESDQLLAQAVVRLNGHILGLVFGLIAGGVLFLATNFLVLKGGDVVGPHLELLNQFFIGYSVTFVGSLIGFGYAFVTGYVGGFIVASIYNFIVWLKNK